MSTLNREQILAADDIKIVKVPVPEWGGDVYVKSLLASQRNEVTACVDDATQKVSFPRLLVMTLVDENGESLGFTADDIEALEKKNLGAVVRIASEAMKINGMVKNAVAEAAKN